MADKKSKKVNKPKPENKVKVDLEQVVPEKGEKVFDSKPVSESREINLRESYFLKVEKSSDDYLKAKENRFKELASDYFTERQRHHSLDDDDDDGYPDEYYDSEDDWEDDWDDLDQFDPAQFDPEVPWYNDPEYLENEREWLKENTEVSEDEVDEIIADFIDEMYPERRLFDYFIVDGVGYFKIPTFILTPDKDLVAFLEAMSLLYGVNAYAEYVEGHQVFYAERVHVMTSTDEKGNEFITHAISNNGVSPLVFAKEDEENFEVLKAPIDSHMIAALGFVYDKDVTEAFHERLGISEGIYKIYFPAKFYM